MLPTRWQPIWQNNYRLATTWYFTRGREVYMKCQGKHWPWQADHWSNPLASCDNGAAHGGFRTSLRASLHSLRVWGWWNDYEWCGWWLWRRMIANTARPEPQGAHHGLIHLHTHLLSPRGPMLWLGPERYSHLGTYRLHLLEVTSLEISASFCFSLLDSYPQTNTSTCLSFILKPSLTHGVQLCYPLPETNQQLVSVGVFHSSFNMLYVMSEQLQLPSLLQIIVSV